MKAWFPFCQKEFRYLYGVDSSELRPLYYLWKCAVIIIDIEKMQKVKMNREDASFVDI